ncbi:MAG: cation diffusion facilitator family transporter [Dehalococcoidia bacterium]
MNQVDRMVRVTLLGSCVNMILVGLKLAVGIVVGSAALVADAVHSISDLASDGIVLLGIRLSSRPADESHAYGHGKFETISTSLVGATLVGAGLYITLEGGLSLNRQEQFFPGYAVVAVAVVSILSKEGIYRITQRVARQVRSSALSVNAWNHRSDALSSVAVLVGAIAGLSGWGYGDQVAALVVGVMIGMVGLNALWKVFIELTEGSVSAEERAFIAEAIHSVVGVRSAHRLRTRLVGREVFMDVHVRVDPQLSVAEGHRICSVVENAIARSTERTINIVVHCEPEGKTAAAEGKDSKRE